MSKRYERNGGKRGILFVIPTGDRTGATILLLHLMRWLNVKGQRPFSILVAGDGEMIPEYEKVAETWAAARSHWCPGGVRSRGLSRIGFGRWASGLEKADVQRFARRNPVGLVYVNSVTKEGARLADLAELAVPVLTHVHELDFLLHQQAGKELTQVLSRSSKFVACSNAVRDNLVGRHGVTPQRVETVYGSIPIDEMRPGRTRAEVLRELEIPENALLVMACGAVDWRKGADLFVQLARLVTCQRKDAHFVWVGGGGEGAIVQFQQDICVAQLNQRVRLTKAVPKPADYIAAADVFVLASREDPFPLVCLEAAALGKPIVCFADAGGTPEFVEEDCGFVVPYLDVARMAERLIFLLDSLECRLRMGAAARRKVTERHDVSVAGPRIAEIIERMITGG